MNREKSIQIAHFLLRAVAGLLFLQAGGMKLFGWFGGMPGGGEWSLDALLHRKHRDAQPAE